MHATTDGLSVSAFCTTEVSPSSYVLRELDKPKHVAMDVELFYCRDFDDLVGLHFVINGHGFL